MNFSIRNEEVKSYQLSQEYMPERLRDFHAQKELFKVIHELVDTDKFGVNLFQAHCYVVDVFLWFMAAHGYTLQKSKKHIDFACLDETLKGQKNIRTDLFLKLFKVKHEQQPNPERA